MKGRLGSRYISFSLVKGTTLGGNLTQLTKHLMENLLRIMLREMPRTAWPIILNFIHFYNFLNFFRKYGLETISIPRANKPAKSAKFKNTSQTLRAENIKFLFFVFLKVRLCSKLQFFLSRRFLQVCDLSHTEQRFTR